MSFLFRLVAKLGLKDGIIIALLAALVFAAREWHSVSAERDNIKTIYANPEVKTVERVVYKEGPVRIKTVVVRVPDGSETTTTLEERGPSETVAEAFDESRPVPLSRTLTRTREDRILLTFGANSLSRDFERKTFLVGYSFKNRFDFQAGIIKVDREMGWAFGTLRF